MYLFERKGVIHLDDIVCYYELSDASTEIYFVNFTILELYTIALVN